MTKSSSDPVEFGAGCLVIVAWAGAITIILAVAIKAVRWAIGV